MDQDNDQVDENTEDFIEENNQEESQELESIEETTEETKEEPEDAAQKAINKKHWEKMQAERETESLRAELNQLRQTQEQAQYSPVSIPEMPDPFDDDYDSKLATRDLALSNQGQLNYQVQFNQQQQALKQEENQRNHNIAVAESMTTCKKNGEAAGVSPDELNLAADKLMQLGYGGDLAMGLVNQQDGAVLIKYLASEPIEAETLLRMSPFQQGDYIARVIRKKAKSLLPKRSKANKPATQLRGGGADPESNKYPMSGGAKFE